ncbi:MAG: carboxymuconolactone decarboxylase family protein [Phycisphaerales bacterium]
MTATAQINALPLVDPATATGKAADLLKAVKAKLGLVPNMTRAMANAPAALDGYLAFSGALSHGVLTAKQREQIALLTAEHNTCHYCLSAHTAIGKMVGLDAAEADAARDARSSDPKATALLKFAKAVLATQGAVQPDQFAAARSAGVTDAEIAEIVANVALNVYTNFFNKAAGTEVDFPIVNPR